MSEVSSRKKKTDIRSLKKKDFFLNSFMNLEKPEDNYFNYNKLVPILPAFISLSYEKTST